MSILALLSLALLLAATRHGSALQVAVEHDLGSGEFTSAGKFKLAKSTQAGRSVKVVLARAKMTENQRTLFSSLVTRDGYYRLRIPGTSQNLDDIHTIMASIHARCLVQAKFQENIVLHVDSSESIYSMDLSVSSRGCRPGLNVTLPPTWSFATETEVNVRKPMLAPVVDAPKSALHESSAEGGAMSGFGEASTEQPLGEDGKPIKKKEEPKTWLEKNWMLVVFGGMLVMNVLGNAATEGGTQQQLGGGAARTRAAPR